MGADPYWYYVPYEEDKNNALQKLKKREFEAGRYRPAIYSENFEKIICLDFPFDDLENAPVPGKIHDTIEDVFEDEMVMEEGTASILDLKEISETEYFGFARVLDKEELIKYFNTEKPTRKIIDEKIWDYWEYTGNYIDSVRGRGVCITVYDGETPAELYFGGYSWD